MVFRDVKITFYSHQIIVEGDLQFSCKDSYSCVIIKPNNRTFIKLNKNNSYQIEIDVTIKATFVNVNQLQVKFNSR